MYHQVKDLSLIFVKTCMHKYQGVKTFQTNNTQTCDRFFSIEEAKEAEQDLQPTSLLETLGIVDDQRTLVSRDDLFLFQFLEQPAKIFGSDGDHLRHLVVFQRHLDFDPLGRPLHFRCNFIE